MNEPTEREDLWLLEEPDVTTIILVSPSASVSSSPEAFAEALGAVTGLEVRVQLPDSTPDDVDWLAAVTVEGLPAALLCSLEPQAAAESGLGKAGLVVQTMLHPGDPLTSLLNVLTLLGMADPEAAGALDANTGRWLDRKTLLDDIVEADVEPRDDLLWVVEAEEYDDTWQLRTCGLRRCGHRELCIADVSQTHIDAAADLLASVASLVLETALPGSGLGIEIGPGLHLTVHADPTEDDAPIQLLDEHGRGAPIDVLERLMNGIVAVYRSQRSSSRHTMLALTTWPRFLGMHAALSARGAQCYVEVAFEQTQDAEERREHVWMEVLEVHGNAVDARPAHAAELATGIEDGPSRIEADEICSWRAVLDDNVWGPENVAALETHLERSSA